MTAGIVQTLIAYREENYVSDRDALPADVGRLVYTDPFAFLVGAAFDRGMPWKRAWEIPYWIHQEGMLDAALLAAAPLDALSRLLKSLPARPRYGGAGTLKSAAELVMEFGGDAAAVWSDASPSKSVGGFNGYTGSAPASRRWLSAFCEMIGECSEDRNQR